MGTQQDFALAMTAPDARPTKTYKPTAAMRAKDGMSKGSIGGPYGAVFGALDGYFNGPLYKSTLPDEGEGDNGSGLPQFRLPNPPPFMPNDYGALSRGAIHEDMDAYGRSDADFRRRHLPVLEAEKLFEKSVLADQQGESELMPAIQNEFMRAGIGRALDSFGDTGGVLAPGSAGEAGVARNLGVSIMGFQDRNRTNRQNSLQLAEQIFPRRQIGMTGEDFALLGVLNNKGLNDYNMANYANQVDAAKLNSNIGAGNMNATTQAKIANANADAAANAALISGIGSAVGGIAGAYAGGGGGSSAASGMGSTGAGGSTVPGFVSSPSGPMTYTRSTGWAARA